MSRLSPWVCCLFVIFFASEVQQSRKNVDGHAQEPFPGALSAPASSTLTIVPKPIRGTPPSSSSAQLAALIWHLPSVMITMPPSRRALQLLVASLPFLVALGATPPGAGENCILIWQNRGECAAGLTCRKKVVGGIDTEICRPPLPVRAVCTNPFSDGFAGCDVGLYCEAGECVAAKKIGEACDNYDEWYVVCLPSFLCGCGTIAWGWSAY